MNWEKLVDNCFNDIVTSFVIEHWYLTPPKAREKFIDQVIKFSFNIGKNAIVKARRSVIGDFEVPDVVKNKIKESHNRLLKAKKNGKYCSCFWCGTAVKSAKITKDHFVPKFFANECGSYNIVPCCTKCNHSRSLLLNMWIIYTKDQELQNSAIKLREEWVQREKKKLGWSFSELLRFE